MAHQLGSFALESAGSPNQNLPVPSLAALYPLRSVVPAAHYTYARPHTSGCILYVLEVLPEISGPI